MGSQGRSSSPLTSSPTSTVITAAPPDSGAAATGPDSGPADSLSATAATA